jgi:hypothetical protein
VNVSPPPAGTTVRLPKLLLGLVSAGAVAHGGLAVVGGTLWAQVMSGVLCVAGLVVVALLVSRPEPHVVLVAALFGMVGVASFLVVLIVALAGGGHPISGWIGPWGIAGVILDSSVVRIAASVLRRHERGQPT